MDEYHMRKSTNRRRGIYQRKPSRLAREIQSHRQTRAQLIQTQDQKERMEAQLAAARSEYNKLVSQMRALHLLVAYDSDELAASRKKIDKLAAEVLALRHLVIPPLTPQGCTDVSSRLQTPWVVMDRHQTSEFLGGRADQDERGTAGG